MSLWLSTKSETLFDNKGLLFPNKLLGFLELGVGMKFAVLRSVMSMKFLLENVALSIVNIG